MKKQLQITALFLFLLATAQPIYSQTLYMGESSIGIGVQYQFASISGQPYHTYVIGVSNERRFDISLAFSRTTIESERRNNSYRAGSNSVQLTFFPSREVNENESFTTELLTGVGIAKVHQDSGLLLMLGAGISKALPQNPSGPSMRPRISGGYILSRIESESSETAQANVEKSIAAEFLVDFRLNESAALIITPSLSYYINENTTGLGISSSFVF